MKDKVGPALPAPLAVSVEAATHLIPVGKTRLYELIKSGAIRSFLCGRSRIIAISEIEAWIQRSMVESDAAAGDGTQAIDR